MLQISFSWMFKGEEIAKLRFNYMHLNLSFVQTNIFFLWPIELSSISLKHFECSDFQTLYSYYDFNR